jgi:nudix-type nucleoside diphosphatase (YffH/AdpP family)
VSEESPPVHIVSQEVLSDDWAILTRYVIDYRRRDGRRQRLVRQVYDRGNGAAILPVDPARRTVLLVRQFRMPIYLENGDGWLIEACAGLNDDLAPEAAIRKEAEEELGYRVRDVRRVLDAHMSPGSVSERLSLFMAAYAQTDRISGGGGAEGEGEDIEVLEVALDDALAMIANGRITDAKTVILLQLADGERRARAAAEG